MADWLQLFKALKSKFSSISPRSSEKERSWGRSQRSNSYSAMTTVANSAVKLARKLVHRASARLGQTRATELLNFTAVQVPKHFQTAPLLEF